LDALHTQTETGLDLVQDVFCPPLER